MATRRMKRIKHTKKHLHHGRRKTNRRHLRNATKRGGMLKALAKKFFAESINERGGPLYGGIQVFKVMVDGKPRYFIGNNPIDKYIHIESSPENKVYGELIKIILSKINSRNINIAIDSPYKGLVYLDQAAFDMFKKQDFDAAAAAAAAAVEASKPDTIEKQIQKSLKLNPNQLSISREFIGYMNYAEVTRAHSIDLKKTKYEFDNFAIQLKDESVIEGKLEVDFVNSQSLQFKLTLNKPAIVTEQFIKCMQDIPASGYYEITSISLTRSQIIITGTVSEIKMPPDRSFYSFDYLVKNFANQYEACLAPTMEELMAELHVDPTRTLQLEVEARIDMCKRKIGNLTPENKKKSIFDGLLIDIEKEYTQNKKDIPTLIRVNSLLTELSDNIK